ncbi:MAG: hypothetical protein KIT84_24830 [Labilithrix sp.]|nr:hypothetical protein [Labilithrix sp.]MCW5814276.1 hypothetical protein [Labilithrix sp.]
MTDPKRLFEDDDLAEKLLGSARADAPTKHSRERTAAALGLAVGAAAATTAVTTKAAATTAKLAGAGLWTKVVAVSAVTVAVAGGGAIVAQRTASPEEPVTETETVMVPVTPSAAPAVRAGGPTARPVEPAPAPTAAGARAGVGQSATAPTAVVTTASPASRPSPARAAPSPTLAGAEPTLAAATESPLARETRLIDDARRALGAGDTALALSLLDRHDATFANGPLRTEASVLRVEALVARGDKPAAKKLADELLARDPSGPHAKRLRSLTE